MKKKKKKILLTYEEKELYELQKVCYICKKIFTTDKNDINLFKLYHKVRHHCHTPENLGELLIVFAI